MAETTIENTEVNTENHVIKTPGILLRKARQAKNLRHDDIAKQIHLSVQWVKNLERDDYFQAPALIYVRGYLRAYARCVGLTSEEIMSAFDALALNEEFERVKAQEEKTIKYQSVSIISHSRRMVSRKIIRWITFLALAILIILASVWWQGKKHLMTREQTQFVMAPNQSLPLKETTQELTLPIAPTMKNKITFSGMDHDKNDQGHSGNERYPPR